MKATLKFRQLFLFGALGTFLTVASSSCKKDDPPCICAYRQSLQGFAYCFIAQQR